jgi:hypothetical protein
MTDYAINEALELSANADDEELYAVYDTVSTEQKTEGKPYFEARTECEKLGGPERGYVVCPINNPPKSKEIVKSEPVKAEPKETGLFDF